MKIDRREFAKLAGVGTLLPWLTPGVLAAPRIVSSVVSVLLACRKGPPLQ